MTNLVPDQNLYNPKVVMIVRLKNGCYIYVVLQSIGDLHVALRYIARTRLLKTDDT